MNCLRSLATALLGGSLSIYAAGDQVSNWNTVAVRATLTAGEGGVTQTRTLAILHVAIHDALNCIEARYERYALSCNVQPGASAPAAVAAAAHDALGGAIAVGALPFTGFGTPALQKLAVAQVDAERNVELVAIPNDSAKSDGIAVGQAAAGCHPGLEKDRPRDRFRDLQTRE